MSVLRLTQKATCSIYIFFDILFLPPQVCADLQMTITSFLWSFFANFSSSTRFLWSTSRRFCLFVFVHAFFFTNIARHRSYLVYLFFFPSQIATYPKEIELDNVCKSKFLYLRHLFFSTIHENLPDFLFLCYHFA